MIEKTRTDFLNIFFRYLKDNALRKTPERVNILTEALNYAGRFDAESLYLKMKSSNYRVSRATVYNTLEILLSCNILFASHFRKNITEYEINNNDKTNCYIICQNCRKVIDFKSVDISLSLHTEIMEELGFDVQQETFSIYAKCLKSENGSCHYH